MDKEADKIKALRLPRFEALIPDELARCVDVVYRRALPPAGR